MKGGEGRMQQGRGRAARRSRGQSTLEYILVLAAILFAIIAVVGTQIKPATEQTMNEAGNAVKNAANKFVTGLGL